MDRMLQALEDLPSVKADRFPGRGEPASCLLAGLPTSSSSGHPVRHSLDRGRELSIVADVRLLERAKLADRLGIAPKGPHADADLVLAAYRRWGLDCVRHLLADGAFALWDEHRRLLFCWRDPAGTRPLYYRSRPREEFVFSSDLRAMVAHPRTSGHLDLAYARSLLEQDLTFQHPARTLVDQVCKLPGGHALTADASGLRVWRYWRPGQTADTSKQIKPEEWVEEARVQIVRAVTDRTRDVPSPVGVHLSGGLDSSSIASIAAGSAGVHGYSWSPRWEDHPPQPGDERSLVELVARHADIPVRFADHDVSARVDVACLDRALHPATMLELEVATHRDARRDGVVTMLSGWGGDEGIAFNGRGFFADRARRGKLLQVQRELRARARLHGGGVLGAWRHRVMEPLLPDPLFHVARRDRRPRPRPLPDELKSEFTQRLLEVDPLDQPPLRERPGVRRMQATLLTFGHLQFRMESWAAFGARVGIEYRFPLLDPRVLDLAMRIPDELYFRHGWKRWIFREAMGDGILPEDVRWNRDKRETSLSAYFAQTEKAVRSAYLERLAARGGHHLVDVDLVLRAAAARDAAARAGQRHDPLAGQRVGGASWLAFTDLTVP